MGAFDKPEPKYRHVVIDGDRVVALSRDDAVLSSAAKVTVLGRHVPAAMISSSRTSTPRERQAG